MCELARRCLSSVILPLTCLFAALPEQVTADNWPALRGSDGRGSARVSGILSRDEPVGLTVRWKVPVGSGYSSVVVADGRVVTMQAGPEQDSVVCLDNGTGQELWSVPVGQTYPGRNGSFDGPLSTPLVVAGRVYALSARGRLVGISLDEGKLLWSRELVKEEGAPPPFYGFVTTPVYAGGHVIVQIGAPQKSTAAFNPATGETVWTAGSDTVSSQTPAVVQVGDEELLLACGGTNLTGLRPATGEIVFEYAHKGGNGNAMTPVALPGGTVLLTLDDSYSSAVSIRANADGFTAKEAWQDRSIKNTYNIPAAWDESVFAFSTRFLTCIDPHSGAARWRSRKPGDGFLIVVDGHLIINTKKGGLHLGRAATDGYHEVAAAPKLFSDLCWSIPAYSDNAIYVRSLKEVARVDIRPVRTKLAADTDRMPPPGGGLRDLLAAVDAADPADKQKLVSEYLARQESFPVVEGRVAQFLYQGDGQDVALASDMFGSRQEKPMRRVPGTNLHYRTVELPSDQRACYIFLVDYKPQRDPRNPRKATSSMYAGEMEFAIRLSEEPPLEMSWFGMPDWKEPAFTRTTNKSELKGTLQHDKVASTRLKSDIPLHVYLPPSYKQSQDDRFPVVYVFGGGGALRFGDLAQSVDKLYASQGGLTQCILVFLEDPPPLGPGLDIPGAVTSDVIPFVDGKYQTRAHSDSRWCIGNGFAANTALMTVATHPDQFSALSVQSPLVFDQAREALVGALQKTEQPLRIAVEWGRFDMFNPHENWDVRKISRSIVDDLQSNPKLTVVGTMVNDSTDWSSWRNRIDVVLGFLAGENTR